jgi:hypothetical protein
MRYPTILLTLVIALTAIGCARWVTPAMQSELDAQRADLQKEIAGLQQNSQDADDNIIEIMQKTFDDMEQAVLTGKAGGKTADEILPDMVNVSIPTLEHVDIEQTPPDEGSDFWLMVEDILKKLGLPVSVSGLAVLLHGRHRNKTRKRDLSKANGDTPAGE